MNITRALLLAIVCSSWAFTAEQAVLFKPVLSSRYDGGYPTEFPAQLGLIQTLLGTAPQEISSQLGIMQYRGGFQHPVTVRFDDGVPAVNENPFFYLEPVDPSKPFAQVLRVNVEAYARQKAAPGWHEDALRKAFYYAMTGLILNDAAGGDPERAIPQWAQEGAGVYLSGAGDVFVERAAANVTLSQVPDLLDDLNRPLPVITRTQYARYYLAVKYIVDTGGTSSFQVFMRSLLNDKSAAEAVRDALGQEWPLFERQVKNYSAQAFEKFALPDTEDTRRTPRANRFN